MPNLERIEELAADIEDVAEELEDVATPYMGHEGEWVGLINKLWNTAEQIRGAIHEEVPDNEEVPG